MLRKLMKQQNHPIIVSAIISLVFAISSLAESPLWQGSLDNNEPIKLSVRSKLGAEVYETTFVVKQKGSDKAYVKTIQVKNDDWGTVRFPNSFSEVPVNDRHISAPRQFYEWECQIQGEVILSGSFYYPNFELKVDNSDD